MNILRTYTGWISRKGKTMIELIFIIVLLGIGVFMVWLATDEFLDNVLCAIVGIIGLGIMAYTLMWALRWVILGGLLQ